MKLSHIRSSLAILLFLAGCGPANVNFSQMEKPAPSPELRNFEPFVGDWTWEAQRIPAEGDPMKWSGTAHWEWALGGTYLKGEMTSSGEGQSFSSEGYWGWHPKRKTYVWWLLNDWGYPQEGTATFDADEKLWTMDFQGVGLDGTTCYGTYTVHVLDENTLEWTLDEWADPTRFAIKKLQMTGAYRRK